MLVDSHCHLDFPDFAEDLDGVVDRARAAGVGGMLTICTHITRFEQVRALANRFPDVWCSVGIHPHEAGREPETPAETLVNLAQDPRVVAFGETGLDYYYNHSPKEDQQRAFRAHIAAARDAGLPVIVHTRDADADTLAILEEEQGRGAFSGLIHCFSSSPELARGAIDLGFYISLSGIVTFPKAQSLRDTIAGLPLDRLLVETDAPYLAPVPRRGKRNEPALVVHTAAKVAEALGVSYDTLVQASTDNFFTLFTKARPADQSMPRRATA